MPRVVDLVGPSIRAHFVRYQSGELWYRVGTFDFPVPISDTGDGAFLAEDGSMYFMRWIRKHLVALDEARKSQSV